MSALSTTLLDLWTLDGLPESRTQAWKFFEEVCAECGLFEVNAVCTKRALR